MAVLAGHLARLKILGFNIAAFRWQLSVKAREYDVTTPNANTAGEENSGQGAVVIAAGTPRWDFSFDGHLDDSQNLFSDPFVLSTGFAYDVLLYVNKRAQPIRITKWLVLSYDQSASVREPQHFSVAGTIYGKITFPT